MLPQDYMWFQFVLPIPSPIISSVALMLNVPNWLPPFDCCTLIQQRPTVFHFHNLAKALCIPFSNTLIPQFLVAWLLKVFICVAWVVVLASCFVPCCRQGTRVWLAYSWMVCWTIGWARTTRVFDEMGPHTPMYRILVLRYTLVPIICQVSRNRWCRHWAAMCWIWLPRRTRFTLLRNTVLTQVWITAINTIFHFHLFHQQYC